MPLGVGTHAVPGVAMPAFWRYSVDAARVARALAGTVQASPTAAYAAGLLHGLGELAMHMIDPGRAATIDRKSTRLNSSHLVISYAVFCLKKKKTQTSSV